MDRQRLGNLWENVRSSFWFVPSLCIGAALLLATLLPRLDRVIEQETVANVQWFFAGDSSAARNLLAAIAQSLITVVSLAFSITIVVVQQASSQFTPRVIRNFVRSLGNQLVLGVYLATFLYCLLVLSKVRGEDSPAGEFVPTLSTTFALLLAAVCVGLLVYFIHKTAISLQASSITSAIHDELLSVIEPLYPEPVGEAVDEDGDDLDTFRRRYATGSSVTVVADTSGYLRVVDDQQMLTATDERVPWAIIYPMVGSFVTRGEPLVEVGGVSTLSEDKLQRLRRVFVLDRQRTLSQDPLFGFRQLTDIALKALSTGMNDQTTAEYALARLGDVLAALATRRFPSRIRHLEREASDGDGPSRQLMVWASGPRFEDFVEAAFWQIRQEARDDVHVTASLLGALRSVNRVLTVPDRVAAVNFQIDEVLRSLEDSAFSAADKARLRDLAAAARAAGHGRWTTPSRYGGGQDD